MKLRRRVKLLYGSGDFGFSLTATFLGAYFSIFLTDVAGLPAAVAALVIFVGRSGDYLNDPVIGFLTDRTRGRLGRRRPYLIFGALPFALCFALLWLKPPLPPGWPLAAYYAAAVLAADIAATFVYLPYYSLTPELSDDYDERTSLTGYRMAFSILGSLAALTLPLALIGTLEPGKASTVFWVAAGIGAAAMAPLLGVGLGMRERPDFVASPTPGIRESLLSAWRNPVFRSSALIFLLTWVAVDTVQASLLYFITHVAGQAANADLIMAAVFVTALASLPFWNWLSARSQKRHAYLIGMAVWLAAQCLLFGFDRETPLAWILFVCCVAGLGVGAGHLIPWSMLPDSVEAGELETRKRTEGAYYSLVTLAQKVASSIAIPAALLIMSACGYRSGAAEQSPSALFGIKLSASLVPALLIALGMAAAWRFRHSRQRHRDAVRALGRAD